MTAPKPGAKRGGPRPNAGRKGQGLMRLEVWIPPDILGWLQALGRESGTTANAAARLVIGLAFAKQRKKLARAAPEEG